MVRKLIVLFLLTFMIVAISTSVAEDNWTLTQYADLSGNQAMCYSLTSGDDLILIDGGWAENASQVREIIENNGGHVTAWFLTHYHNDHAGAFNELWEEYKDRIDVVYCTPLIWDDFIAVAKDWDSPETFETFLKITDGDPRIVRLNRNDKIEISGLKISVFNAYDDIVKKYYDIANNCSLVFSISSSNTSVLFFGDLWNHDLGMEILNLYGVEDLHADYIQAGHHGNSSKSFELYEAINPSVVFLDGPEWLMTDENYDAKDLIAWCEKMGIDSYDYRQSPTSMYMN